MWRMCCGTMVRTLILPRHTVKPCLMCPSVITMISAVNALLNCIETQDWVIALGERAEHEHRNPTSYLVVSEGVFLIGKEPVSLAGRSSNAKEFEHLKADIWHTGRTNVWTGSVAEGLKQSGVTPTPSSASQHLLYRVDVNEIYRLRNFRWQKWIQTLCSAMPRVPSP